MTTERSEEEKITQAGIKVILGGEEYTIPPLTIQYSGPWRKKAMPLYSHLIQYSRMSMDGKNVSEELEQKIVELFTTKTDEMIDCFFEYARDLDRQELAKVTTDGEIILAFMEVFNAFVIPLSQRVAKAKTPNRKSRRLAKPSKS